MDTKEILDKEFSEQKFPEEHPNAEILNRYKEIACNYARMENAIAVLSDLRNHASYIYYGRFSQMLGAGNRKKRARYPPSGKMIYSGSFIPTIWQANICRNYAFFILSNRSPGEDVMITI